MSASFGRAHLEQWPLDPGATYLNHGTVGVAPRRVLEAQQRLRDRIERHPSRFMLRQLWSFTGSAADGPTLMREAAREVAAFVGARPDDLVFIDNTTAGVNGVMQSLPLAPGDDIVVTDHAYGGIVTAVRHWAARAGASVQTVTVPYPAFDPARTVERIVEAVTARTRLVIVDHIASETALVFPVEAIVRGVHERGAPVLVDGAHVPGQLPLDITAIGADIYVANLHKWAMAPRSSAFMVASPEFQSLLHPPVISWGYETGYTQEFDWVGTRDPSPWLTAPEAIRFLQEIGYDALRAYNHGLAWHAARYLTERWHTRLEIDESAVGSMVTLPAPDSCGTTKADAVRLRDRLLFDRDIEVHAHARAGRVWVRICAQVYNDTADIERLGEAVLEG
jgi:isopenicillin-N epimerase